jgi:hypothetical protein
MRVGFIWISGHSRRAHQKFDLFGKRAVARGKTRKRDNTARYADEMSRYYEYLNNYFINTIDARQRYMQPQQFLAFPAIV